MFHPSCKNFNFLNETLQEVVLDELHTNLLSVWYILCPIVAAFSYGKKEWLRYGTKHSCTYFVGLVSCRKSKILLGEGRRGGGIFHVKHLSTFFRFSDIFHSELTKSTDLLLYIQLSNSSKLLVFIIWKKKLETRSFRGVGGALSQMSEKNKRKARKIV